MWDMDDLASFLLEDEDIGNTTDQPNVGLHGAAQFQPPKENAEERRSLCKPPEKKRWKTVEQVRGLEASFIRNNKLRPHQKTRLAEELGLEPRQVVLWFKNRRAQTKGKRFETEYYLLKNHYDSLKGCYDHLLAKTQRLHNETSMLYDELMKLGNGEKSNSSTMGGSMSLVEGNKFLVAPGSPSKEEDPMKGLEPPSIGSVFGSGRMDGDAFDSEFDESFDFLLSGMDDQFEPWFSELGF